MRTSRMTSDLPRPRKVGRGRPLAWLLVGALVAMSVNSVTGAPAAWAKGRSGYCTTADKNAVTVAIDFGDLGGGTRVYCASGLRSGATGMDALRAVGVPVNTVKGNSGFVCRLRGKPAANQKISIPGDSEYTEDCKDTPPAAAYWSYWSASAGGSWRYNMRGATSNKVMVGGYEGWSFAHNAGSGGVAPRVRPVAHEPAKPKPAAPKPAAPKPTAPKPTATKPTATKPTATKPTATSKPTVAPATSAAPSVPLTPGVGSSAASAMAPGQPPSATPLVPGVVPAEPADAPSSDPPNLALPVGLGAFTAGGAVLAAWVLRRRGS